MSKLKLFLDFDNTITSSTEAFCDVYNNWYQNEPNFTPAKWHLVDKWNFDDQCLLLEGKNEKVEEIFGSPDFFTYLDFLNGNTKEIIEKLCEKYDVIIVTIGTLDNIALKSKYIKEKLSCIKECIFLVNDGCVMNKSQIDMQGAVFLDDVSSNLNSSNADVKICVGDEYSWNKDWNGVRCYNWTDIGDLLL